MADTTQLPISVVICTKDERLNIGRCLASLRWASEVFVVDSFSTDGTAEIAEREGAKVIRHEWSGYSDQKNWALEQLPIGNRWVLFLDADEQVSPELAAELVKAINNSDGSVAFFIPRRMIFLGRWLKRTWWYPDYNLRLFVRGTGRFESREVHETVIVSGRCDYLKGDIIHDDQRDIATYVARLNRYSSLEAREMRRVRDGSTQNSLRPSLAGHWTERRRALKEFVWYRVPFKPVVRLFWCLIIRRGLLDGRPGVVFAGLAAFNDWMQDVKAYENRLIESGLRIDPTAQAATDDCARQP